MKKIFKLLNRYAVIGINILVRIFLRLAYLVLLFPFAIAVRLRSDYLGIKVKPTYWIPLDKKDDVKELLSSQ
ncbi:MAG: hypothetical protein NT014_06165 [Candidatus Omnitrophica bacterium]|nr:hypothetical protein [Candidatus Omnitrophota bacterium]